MKFPFHLCHFDFCQHLLEFWYCNPVSLGRVRGSDMTVVTRIVLDRQRLRDFSTELVATGWSLNARLSRIGVESSTLRGHILRMQQYCSFIAHFSFSFSFLFPFSCYSGRRICVFIDLWPMKFNQSLRLTDREHRIVTVMIESVSWNSTRGVRVGLFCNTRRLS